MVEPCFLLTDEKWIRVMRPDGEVDTCSLREVLLRAQEYRCLAGESPTQDFAMLRFLLAVLYAALFREPFDNPDDALLAWLALWNEKHFPAEVDAYLDRWKDRFWLFDDKRPFMQVPYGKDGLTMENAAELTVLEKPGKPSLSGVQRASKLNGTIFESANKEKLFNAINGAEKDSLSLPEAARWLLHVIGFDDGGIKHYYKQHSEMNRADEAAKCSVSWLGSISPVYAEGDTLFETLMLNLVLLKDGDASPSGLWPRQVPSWEYEDLHLVEAMGTPPPDNPAELCSFLSRRILLIRKEDRVLGFVRYVGEAFSKEAAGTEQWTLWSVPKKQKNGPAGQPVPRSGRLKAQMWRELNAMLSAAGREGYQPGVIRWVGLLSGLTDSPLGNRPCRFHYVKALYEVAQSSNMTEILDDSVTFSNGLLTWVGRGWVATVTAELERCNHMAWQLGRLAQDILGAEGGQVRDNKGKMTPLAQACSDSAQEQFFHEMDGAVRLWLQDIPVEGDSETNERYVSLLRDTARQTAWSRGRALIGNVSPAAYNRRKQSSGEHITVPEAWVRFEQGLRRIYSDQETGGVRD